MSPYRTKLERVTCFWPLERCEKPAHTWQLGASVD